MNNINHFFSPLNVINNNNNVNNTINNNNNNNNFTTANNNIHYNTNNNVSPQNILNQAQELVAEKSMPTNQFTQPAASVTKIRTISYRGDFWNGIFESLRDPEDPKFTKSLVLHSAQQQHNYQSS